MHKGSIVWLVFKEACMSGSVCGGTVHSLCVGVSGEMSRLST